MEKFAKWDKSAVKVHLHICDNIDGLKDMWIKMQPIMKEHLTKEERQEVNKFKEILKKRLLNINA